MNSQEQANVEELNIRSQIGKVLDKPQPKESKFFTTKADEFCSGLVTKVFNVDRRLYSIPFDTCIVSHTGLVCETTRKRAYMIEFCENFPILTHDVTDTWSFTPASKWNYGGYTYNRDVMGATVPIVSYNVQYVGKMFQASADLRGPYILSGNNCHVVKEQAVLTLGLANQAGLHYGTYITEMNLEYNPLTEMKPYYYM